MSERGPLQLLDEGLALYRRDAAVLTAVSALVWIPLAVLAAAVALPDPDTDVDRFFTLPQLLGSLALLPVAAAVAVADDMRRKDEIPRFGSVVRRVGRRAPALAGTWLVVHALQLVGVVTLGILTILVLVWAVPATPVVVIEQRAGFRAFQRSRELVLGRFGVVVAQLVILGVVMLVVRWMLVGLIAVVSSFDIDLLTRASFAVVVAGAGLLVEPMVAGSSVALYRELRVVHEGADLEERLERLGA